MLFQWLHPREFAKSRRVTEPRNPVQRPRLNRDVETRNIRVVSGLRLSQLALSKSAPVSVLFRGSTLAEYIHQRIYTTKGSTKFHSNGLVCPRLLRQQQPKPLGRVHASATIHVKWQGSTATRIPTSPTGSLPQRGLHQHYNKHYCSRKSVLIVQRTAKLWEFCSPLLYASLSFALHIASGCPFESLEFQLRVETEQFREISFPSLPYLILLGSSDSTLRVLCYFPFGSVST